MNEDPNINAVRAPVPPAAPPENNESWHALARKDENSAWSTLRNRAGLEICYLSESYALDAARRYRDYRWGQKVLVTPVKRIRFPFDDQGVGKALAATLREKGYRLNLTGRDKK